MTPDRFPVRVVVLSLAFTVIGGLGSIVFLASTQTPIPDALDRLVFLSLGAISALLAKTSGTGDKVQIDNAIDDPVPVEQVE